VYGKVRALQRLRLAETWFWPHRAFHASPRLRRFPIAPRGIWFPANRDRFCRSDAAGGMSRAPRFAGYALMAVAALLALAMRRGAVDSIGPFPVAAVALLIGMIGVMIVFTDLMVRGLYAQVGAAQAAAPDEETRRDDEE
jgi:hypothetical protein